MAHIDAIIRSHTQYKVDEQAAQLRPHQHDGMSVCEEIRHGKAIIIEGRRLMIEAVGGANLFWPARW